MEGRKMKEGRKEKEGRKDGRNLLRKERRKMTEDVEGRKVGRKEGK
jgi:hypothetical protein